jgi:hypothetical protein
MQVAAPSFQASKLLLDVRLSPQVTIFTRSGRMGCPFVIPPHPVCGRGTKPRGRLRVGLSPIPDAEPLTFCCQRWRGLASPDDGDALALTFAYPVAKRDWAEGRRFEEGLLRLKRWIV